LSRDEAGENDGGKCDIRDHSASFDEDRRYRGFDQTRSARVKREDGPLSHLGPLLRQPPSRWLEHSFAKL
jgi:hypothetical protein